MDFRAASLLRATASVYFECTVSNSWSLTPSCCFQTKDCNVMASKLMFLLDDLLWVLTDSQLKAMMKYAESLSEAMEKSAQQRKSLAPDSVQVSEPWFGCWPFREEKKTGRALDFLLLFSFVLRYSIAVCESLKAAARSSNLEHPLPLVYIFTPDPILSNWLMNVIQ